MNEKKTAEKKTAEELNNEVIEFFKYNEKTEKTVNKKAVALSAVTVLVFFGLLVLFAVMTVFGEKKTFSELENRNLERFPKYDSEDFFGGEYTDDIEVYTADHFFGRDMFVKFKTMCDLAMGRHERNDVYILKNRLVQRFDAPDEKAVGRSIDAINAFADEIKKPVFMMLVPTSGEIYADELPSNAPMESEKDFIEDVYSRLNSSVSAIDVYNTLKLSEDEYIYYRNDHHWTSRGAYLAYYTAGKKMGYTPGEMNRYDIEHASSDFKGSLYSRALYDGIEADTLDIYRCMDGFEITGEYAYSSSDDEGTFTGSIYHRENLDRKDKYLTFTGENMPVVTVTSDSTGGSLLIVKDSYANCYLPFLMQHYSKVTMIDLRYMQISYKEFIDINRYDQVLILYNALTFSTDKNIPRLGL